MNKKILLSLTIIGIVAAITIGATTAFFSDTETSTGNIFTAGSIDLKVDHTMQSYNGADCQTCSVILYSGDGNNYVTDASENAANNSGFPRPAVLVSGSHSAWTSHPTSSWIWEDSSTAQADTENEVEYTFERTFYWQGPVTDIDFGLGLSSDNGYEIYINDVSVVDKLDEEDNYSSMVGLTSGEKDIFTNNINQPGENVLRVVVRNHEPDGFTGSPESNPGGLLYYLSIQSDCENEIFQGNCTLFGEKDLGKGDKFFHFEDIKPGDHGRNVISLHVYDNDAWGCLIAHKGEDDENEVLEPELQLGDDDSEGELQNYINLFAWIDDGDGKYQDTEEDLGFSTLGDLDSIASFDSINQKYLTSTSTKYIGIAWCAGDISLDGSEIVCDGAGMKNDAQSDIFMADLTAYAEQKRNNPDFECSASLVEEEEDSGDNGGEQ